MRQDTCTFVPADLGVVGAMRGSFIFGPLRCRLVDTGTYVGNLFAERFRNQALAQRAFETSRKDKHPGERGLQFFTVLGMCFGFLVFWFCSFFLGVCKKQSFRYHTKSRYELPIFFPDAKCSRPDTRDQTADAARFALR